MKNTVLLLLIIFGSALCIYSQNSLSVYQKNSSEIIQLSIDDIDSITFANYKRSPEKNYPTSFPFFTKAFIDEKTITYGDSIHFHISVSDQYRTITYLTINPGIGKIYTYTSSKNLINLNRAIKIPFQSNSVDDANLLLKLSAKNSAFQTTDTIVKSVIVKRPILRELYAFIGSSKPILLECIDSSNYLFKSKDLINLQPPISLKLASKVRSIYGFKRIDWSGIVFGKADNGIGIIDSIGGDSYTANDPTLTSITGITFDAKKFDVLLEGNKIFPISKLDVISDLQINPSSLNNGANFRGGEIYLEEGKEILFTGISDLSNNLTPDYFEVISPTTAKFIGKSGFYKAYFYIPTTYLYIEPLPNLVYPDVLWVCGAGFGRPQSPYNTTSSWNWNNPLDYVPCRKISSGVYQVTMYCKNTLPTYSDSLYGTLDFKFFHKRGWWDGHETWVDSYTISPPFLGPTGAYGNVKVTKDAIIDGVYRFTLNENNKTLSVVKIK